MVGFLLSLLAFLLVIFLVGVASGVSLSTKILELIKAVETDRVNL